jgi:predicted phosphoribosyltransferase
MPSSDVIVLALSRGGLPVASEVAMGAIGTGGAYVLNYEVVEALHISRSSTTDWHRSLDAGVARCALDRASGLSLRGNAASRG